VGIYRWDLDKTYLDTDFQSLRGIVRTATEPAHAKRALPGAAALLRALGECPQSRITVLSGSPTQMRSVLTEKLRLDGIRFEALVLKDNLGNVRRGRFRALRGQLGYKLPALLRARVETPAQETEVLFGDDVEADALIYSLYADAVSGQVGAAEVSRVMERGGAYPDEIDDALASLVRIERSEAVERIFIRTERGVPSRRMAALGPRVVPIRSWWQAALVLMQMGHLGLASVEAVMSRVLDGEGGDPWVMGALAQDLLRRGWIEPAILLTLKGSPQMTEALSRAVAALDGHGIDPTSSQAVHIDYMALLDSGSLSKHGRSE
jgi:hypothetical protein